MNYNNIAIQICEENFSDTIKDEDANQLIMAIYKHISELPEALKYKALINMMIFINRIEDKDVAVFMAKTFVCQNNAVFPLSNLDEWNIFRNKYKEYVFSLSNEKHANIEKRFIK